MIGNSYLNSAVQPLLANTILASNLPYIFVLLLSPLILLIEATVAWKRHRPLIRFGKAFGLVSIANAASTFVGMLFAKGGIRGFQDVSKEGEVVATLIWAWAMSCVVEYAMMRSFMRDSKPTEMAVTIVLMNLASYALVSASIWRLIR